MPESSVQSKRILVTGSSRGIGAAIAERLLSDGHQVTGTNYRTDFPESISSHTSFQGINVNLSDSAEVKSKIAPLFSGSNPPDVLINNAAIFETVQFENPDDEEFLEGWNRHCNINMLIPAYLTRLALNSWVPGRKGIIINISSRAAYRGETKDYAPYAATKAALTGLTKTVARGYGKDGITAFTIAPGYVETDMAVQAIKQYGKDAVTKDNTLDDIIPPEQIGELCSVIVTGKLSHMTGTTLHINSGSYLI